MKKVRRRPCPGPRAGASHGIVPIVLVAIALGPFGAVGAAQEAERRNPRQYFFTQTFGDLREELETARGENKLGMLLFFEMEECPYCRAMLRDVFSDPEVQDWFATRFVSVAIDVRGDVEFIDFDGVSAPTKVLAAQRDIGVTPVITFTNLSGGEIYRHWGSVGSPAELLLIGRYVAEGHYGSIGFRAWAEKQGAELPDRAPGTRVTE